MRMVSRRTFAAGISAGCLSVPTVRTAARAAQFSWKWAVAPAAIGFADTGLGRGHIGNLFVGASRTFLDEGYLFEFKFDGTRQHFAFSDSHLKDGVDNNDYKHSLARSSVPTPEGKLS